MPVYKLKKEIVFPNPNNAHPCGLLAVGGDLSFERLLLAYTNGIFPWFTEGEPILWWSPDPRLVLFPEKLKVSKSLKQTIRSKKFNVKFDTNFEEVINCCAEVPRKNEDGTWITKEMIEAYNILYKQGFAHSVETYYKDKLVGGLYGVSLGRAFFGESMFHFMTDASKVALFYLVEKLKLWKFDFIDAQIKTGHLLSLGAEEINRKKYLKLLNVSLISKTIRGPWSDL